MKLLAALGLGIALGAFACKAEPPAADCSTVSSGVKAYWTERATVAESDEERSDIAHTLAITADRLERHCKADGWSADAIICVRAVFRLDDSGCMKKLTPQQAGALLMDESTPRPVGGGVGLGN